ASEPVKASTEAKTELATPQFAVLDSGSGQGFAARWSLLTRYLSLAFKALMLTWIFYVTTAYLILMLAPAAPLWTAPMTALEPFRIANQYGLFAVMTTARYEIEFQGTRDGETWAP